VSQIKLKETTLFNMTINANVSDKPAASITNFCSSDISLFSLNTLNVLVPSFLPSAEVSSEAASTDSDVGGWVMRSSEH
jgi:hypothetical protein